MKIKQLNYNKINRQFCTQKDYYNVLSICLIKNTDELKKIKSYTKNKLQRHFYIIKNMIRSYKIIKGKKSFDCDYEAYTYQKANSLLNENEEYVQHQENEIVYNFYNRLTDKEIQEILEVYSIDMTIHMEDEVLDYIITTKYPKEIFEKYNLSKIDIYTVIYDLHLFIINCVVSLEDHLNKLESLFTNEKDVLQKYYDYKTIHNKMKEITLAQFIYNFIKQSHASYIFNVEKNTPGEIEHIKNGIVNFFDSNYTVVLIVAINILDETINSFKAKNCEYICWNKVDKSNDGIIY